MIDLLNAILVDDEVFTRKGLIKLIDWEACGFRIVAEGDNGEDALELIRSIRPDLVITDIRMPILDGLELIRQTVRDPGASPAFILISGYDDFKYAQQAVRYGVHDFILKPIDEGEFSDTLRRLGRRLRQEREAKEREERLQSGAMIEAIVTGAADEAFVAEWEKRLQLAPGENLYYLLAELNDGPGWPSSKDNGPFSRLGELVRETLRRLTGESRPFYVYEHRNRIGVIVPERALRPFGGKIRPFAEALVQSFQAGDGRLFVYVGRPVSRLSALREAYETAKETLPYKYVYDDSGIVIYGELGGQPVRYLGADQSLCGELLEHMEELRFDRLQATVDALFRDFRDKRCAPEAVKMNIDQCVLGMIRIIRGMDGDERALSCLEPMMSWHDSNLSLGGLKRLFTAFATECGRYIAELRKDRQKGGIQKIRAYIEEHYRENLSLKSIAAKFYINPVYLGQLFKRTYGIYFNEFLLQLRVNEAKRLLRQTDLRVYEVAERVGFSNPDYFVTQFEKLERVTPGEYRSRLLKEGASDGTNR